MDDLKYLKRTFDLARMARNGGKGPFAALLVRSGTGHRRTAALVP